MELRLTSAALIFFGSYSPLALILFVQDIDIVVFTQPLCHPSLWLSNACALPLAHPRIATTFLMLACLCLAIFLYIIGRAQSTTDVDIVESKHIPADLMSYVFPYIVSFMGFDYENIPKILGALVFLLCMFLMTYRSGNILLNPFLVVFGWRLYEIKFKYPTGNDLHQKRAICKEEILLRSRYEVLEFQDVFITKKKA